MILLGSFSEGSQFPSLVAILRGDPLHGQNYVPSWKFQQGVVISHFSSKSFRGETLHGEKAWRVHKF